MQPKIIKTSLAEYVQVEWNGKNESGVTPIGDRVLVMPDVAATVRKSGLHIDPSTVERNSLACETGVIVAVGDAAFTWNSDRSRPYAGYMPAPGDRVFMTRYGGQNVLGDDGVVYRLIDDNMIGGLSKKELQE